MNEDCIFCNINVDTLVYKDERGIVLLDDPIRPGHVLIGCNKHKAFLHDIESDEAAQLFSLVNEVSKVIVNSTGAEKVYMCAIGDKDHHFHVHLVPRLEGESGLGPFVFGEKGWAEFLDYPPSDIEVDDISKEIVQSLYGGS